MQVIPDSLARMLFPRSARSLELTADALIIVSAQGTRRLARSEVTGLLAERGWLWDRLRVNTALPGISPDQIRGLPHGQAAALAKSWDVLSLSNDIMIALSQFSVLLKRDAYLNHQAFEDWRLATAALRESLPARVSGLWLPQEISSAIEELRRLGSDGERIVAERNDQFVARQRATHAAWFETAGVAEDRSRYALTDEQQEAVLRDEDNCLLVAGAGTGKTSAVAGKVAFLLHVGAADPANVLLLAFTRKSAAAMSNRLKKLVGSAMAERLSIRTFHALGTEILAHADGKAKPSLSLLADDEAALGDALTRYLKKLLTDPKTQQDALTFFAYHLYPLRSLFEFTTAHEQYQWDLSHDIRTLKGERVKSHEELLIANWLFMNGIAYEYERAYPHDTATVQHRQYKPDFFLCTSGAYLEHWGIDREGWTARYVPGNEYRARMAWARGVHKEHGTTLLETFSYERSEGTLLSSLEAKLRSVGVLATPLSPKEVLEALERENLVTPVAKLLGTFLHLFKGNLWTEEDLVRAASQPADPAHPRHNPSRASAFLALFRGVLTLYEAELNTAKEIDFDDMIAAATARVESREYVSRFSHVIVDEFQDLSRGRGRLLRSLLAQVSHRRLFCVGDDWQSIYRFTGSDINQMLRFPEEYGFTHRCDLTMTHRFSTELLQVTSAFVQKNPAQLRKTLRSATSLGGRAIEVSFRGTDESPRVHLERALAHIGHAAGATGDARPSVLLLGRYNFLEPRDLPRLQQDFPGLRLAFLSVHMAKGLEADYVVLLDVTAGKFGFPSELSDDPLLDLVLPIGDHFEHSEERRVFYVALTRARKRCIVLSETGRTSLFIEELALQEDGGANGEKSTRHCSACGGGSLVPRTGDYGPFFGCTNYPRCEGKARHCPVCHLGPMIGERAMFRCSSRACGVTAERCPSCNVGMLVARQGPFGPFYGCTEWRPPGAGPSCKYTRLSSEG